MAELFTASGFFTLLMLLALQAVLGFDNLLYISIESKRVGEAKAPTVRRWGIGLAILFRIILLIVIVNLFSALQRKRRATYPAHPVSAAPVNLPKTLRQLSRHLLLAEPTKRSRKGRNPIPKHFSRTLLSLVPKHRRAPRPHHGRNGAEGPRICWTSCEAGMTTERTPGKRVRKKRWTTFTGSSSGK